MLAESTEDAGAMQLDAGLGPRPANDDDDDLDLRALRDNCVSVREWTHTAQLICRDRVV